MHNIWKGQKLYWNVCVICPWKSFNLNRFFLTNRLRQCSWSIWAEFWFIITKWILRRNSIILWRATLESTWSSSGLVKSWNRLKKYSEKNYFMKRKSSYVFFFGASVLVIKLKHFNNQNVFCFFCFVKVLEVLSFNIITIKRHTITMMIMVFFTWRYFPYLIRRIKNIVRKSTRTF